MNGAGALCEAEGEALRRALALAFGDEALAARCTAAAFVRARRRWRVVSAQPDPMAWVDVTAVRRGRRRLDQREGHDASAGDVLVGLGARARVAVVLHAHRGRSVGEVADALGTSPADAEALLRDGYRTLGVVDVVIEDSAMPYAR